MNRFLGFVTKEFRHIFRDYRTLIILFGMPIAQIMIFGFAISNEIKNANISILNQSGDEVSLRLENKILSSGYFTLHNYLQSNSQIENEFREGTVKEVIVIGPDFSHQLAHDGKADIQIIADATDPNTANTLTSYTMAIISDFQHEQMAGINVPYTVTPAVRFYYNPELKSVFMFVPGLITIILMLISAMMTSISITREKETGTMEILMVSPMKPLQIIVGKVIPYLLLSFIIANIILLLGRFVFEVPVTGNIILLEAMVTLFIITALSLGIMISTVTDKMQVAMMISMIGLMMPTILLSGFIFPIKNMPLLLQVISNVIPARWFIIIVRGIMLKGNGLEYIWKEALILSGMTFFFLMVSARRYKVRLE
ncbi:MAG: ABC transporter permease [Chitinophagales bacterium]|nr:ABC transporter permease [Chitinophagales bacterium]